MRIIGLVLAPTLTSILCSVTILITQQSYGSLTQRLRTFPYAQKICPPSAGPEFDLLRILPTLSMRCRFRAFLLTSLCQMAQGTHISQIYQCSLDTRLHRTGLPHNRVPSSTWNLPAMRFRRCHSVGPCISFLTDISLPRFNPRICLSISAWLAILLRQTIHSLQSLRPVQSCSAVATISSSMFGHRVKLRFYMVISPIHIVS